MNTLGTLPGIIGVATAGWLVDTTGSYDSVLLLAGVIGVGGRARLHINGLRKATHRLNVRYARR